MFFGVSLCESLKEKMFKKMDFWVFIFSTFYLFYRNVKTEASLPSKTFLVCAFRHYFFIHLKAGIVVQLLFAFNMKLFIPVRGFRDCLKIQHVLNRLP
jgi:hypothetical protein